MRHCPLRCSSCTRLLYVSPYTFMDFPHPYPHTHLYIVKCKCYTFWRGLVLLITIIHFTHAMVVVPQPLVIRPKDDSGSDLQRVLYNVVHRLLDGMLVGDSVGQGFRNRFVLATCDVWKWWYYVGRFGQKYAQHGRRRAFLFRVDTFRKISTLHLLVDKTGKVVFTLPIWTLRLEWHFTDMVAALMMSSGRPVS